MNARSTRASEALIGLSTLTLAGCQFSGDHSPAVDILGSYFPAWMISIVGGLLLTLIVRSLLILLHLKPALHPAALILFCLWVIFTLGTWIVFFKN
ncbi:MAG TPA: YtcA family lipoprotein [Chthoniobacter sp.]